MNLRILGFTDAATADHTIQPAMPFEATITAPVSATDTKRTMIDKLVASVRAAAPAAQLTDVHAMVRQTVANTRDPFDDTTPVNWPPGHVHLALTA